MPEVNNNQFGLFGNGGQRRVSFSNQVQVIPSPAYNEDEIVGADDAYDSGDEDVAMDPVVANHVEDMDEMSEDEDNHEGPVLRYT